MLYNSGDILTVRIDIFRYTCMLLMRKFNIKRLPYIDIDVSELHA